MNRGTLGMPIGWRGRISHSPNTFRGAKVSRVVTTQTVTSGVDTYAIWDTVVYDTGRFVDLQNFPTRLTVQRGGWYEAGGNADVVLNVNATARIRIDYGTQAGGSAVKNLARGAAGSTTAENTNPCVTTAFFEPGDYVELALFQNTGSSRSWGAPGAANEFALSLYLTRVG